MTVADGCAELARRRAYLIRCAEITATELCARFGETDAPTVLRCMRAVPRLAFLMDGHDPRWIGALWSKSGKFERTGRYSRSGSHGRHANIWRLASERG